VVGAAGHPRLNFRAAVIGTVLLLAGCATPAQRITTKLVDLGVPAANARCMGDRLAARLTTSQIVHLARLPGIDGATLRQMSLHEIVQRVTAVGDPGLVAEVVRAGIGCAV